MAKSKAEKDSSIMRRVLSLKYHPTILELKFCSIYDELYQFYGGDMCDKLVFSLGKCFDCSERLLKALINNKHRIQINKVYNVTQYKRTLIVMGLSWGYDKTYIAEHYFKNNQSSAYRGNYVSLSFLDNNKWEEELNYSTCVLNTERAVEELKNFIINLDTLIRLLS